MKLEVVATLFTYFQASSSSIKLKHQAEALQVKVALEEGDALSHSTLFADIITQYKYFY